MLLDYFRMHVTHPEVRTRDPARVMGCPAFAFDCVASTVDCACVATCCRRVRVRYPTCETRCWPMRTRYLAMRVVDTVVTADCCSRMSNCFHIAVA
jgi:hypothetical protein